MRDSTPKLTRWTPCFWRIARRPEVEVPGCASTPIWASSARGRRAIGEEVVELALVEERGGAAADVDRAETKAADDRLHHGNLAADGADVRGDGLLAGRAHGGEEAVGADARAERDVDVEGRWREGIPFGDAGRVIAPRAGGGLAGLGAEDEAERRVKGLGREIEHAPNEEEPGRKLARRANHEVTGVAKSGASSLSMTEKTLREG